MLFSDSLAYIMVAIVAQAVIYSNKTNVPAVRSKVALANYATPESFTVADRIRVSCACLLAGNIFNVIKQS